MRRLRKLFKCKTRVRVCSDSQRQLKKTEGEITDTTKVTILFAGITNVYVNVRGGCVVFS